MAIPYLECPITADARDCLNRRLRPCRRYARHMIPNLVDNGDFEDTDAPDEADRWDFSASGAGNFVQMLGPGSAHSGDACVRLYAENTGNARITTASPFLDFLPGYDHGLILWYQWQNSTGDTSLTLRITYWLGAVLVDTIDTVLPTTGAGWKRHAATIAAKSADTITVRLTVAHAGLSSNSDLLLDDIVIYPLRSDNWTEGFELTHSDFAATTAGSVHRYDFPHCPNSHDAIMDDPVTRPRSELGDLFQMVGREPLTTYVMEYPTLPDLFVRLLRQLYLNSRGQELTFGDWDGRDRIICWPGPWTAPTDFNLVAPVSLSLIEVEAGVRETGAF